MDSLSASRVRRKRQQVARACDGCRIQRIKCDNKYPCTNCDARGRDCSNTESTRTSTLSQAHDEIAQLKQRIRELEEQLSPQPGSLTTASNPSTQASPLSGISHGGRTTQVWDGVKLCPARAPNESWFGPSSLYYFLQRLNSSLITALPQNLKPDRLFLTSTTTKRLLAAPGTGSDPQGSDAAGGALSPMQEQYFIDLYWHSYHTTVLPIIDEAEFKDHHQSLWSASGTTRKPSALVDIVLALCMKLDENAMPVESSADGADGTAIPGRCHYRRCQALLAHEMESPSITTLQCQLLSAVYLCGGSFHNMVDTAVAVAVRTAYTLGLHLEAPAGTPRKEVERRRRLWWAVYLMECKIGMKLGRPFQIRDSHAMPELPSDDCEAAMISGSRFVPVGNNKTWLTFNLHHIQLHRAVRAAHVAFYDRDLHLPTGRTMWDDVDVLESQAELLLSYSLDDWASAVPNELLAKRSGEGKPLSTDHSPLELERFAPIWLQRQRLWLEVAYHNWSVLLYRPFISFSVRPAPGSAAEKLANRCAAHAIALTKLMQQILSSTIILDGSYEVFHFQWSIAMSLVGFVLAYPDWPSTPAAREAMDTAVAVFDMYGRQYPVALNAAAIMRELCVRIDHVNGQRLPRPTGQIGFGGGEGPDSGPQILAGPALDASMSNMALADGGWDGTGQNLFDMALDVDFWDEMNALWPDYGTTLPGSFSFPQTEAIPAFGMI